MNSDVSYDPPIAIENGLDLRELLTTGSILHLNGNYDEVEHVELKNNDTMKFDYIGEPVTSIDEFQKQLTHLDNNGLVKKKILEEGGGLPMDKKFTVSFAYSGYWQNSNEPFDFAKISKPLVVNLNDSGLLPGLQMAIESMLVGEMSVFLLSYKVMYGKLGIPPRIKPKADCIFYIKLIKSIITPNEGEIDFAEPNMFDRVRHEVQLFYSSGIILFKTNNYTAAIREFKKAVNMMHKCRLADRDEEVKQEILLKKLYLNLAVCHNKLKQPLRACTACNELNRLKGLWNNEKALFQNAKALRMIGDFDGAEKKLKAAMKLSSNDSLIAELNLVYKLKEIYYNKKKLMSNRLLHNTNNNLVSDHFKSDVNDLIKKFKENVNLCKFTLPGDLNIAEKEYFKEACIKENLYFTEYNMNRLLEKDEENLPIESRVNILQ